MPWGKNDKIVQTANPFDDPHKEHSEHREDVQTALSARSVANAERNSARDAERQNTLLPYEAQKAAADATIAQQKADEAKAQTAIQTMGSNSNVHGEEYLQKFVPPAMQNVVRAYARGDLGSRAGGFSTSMLPIIQHAMNFDPNASGTNFPARVKMQGQLADQNPQSAGGQLKAFERMLLHGENVLDSGLALNNYHSGFLSTIPNHLRQWNEQANQSGVLSHFAEQVRNYAPEAQKAISGGLGGQEERKDRGSALTGAESPETLVGALQGDAQQAMGGMAAVNDQYKRLMGHDITDMLAPDAKRAYAKIMAGGYDAKGNALIPAPGYSPETGNNGPPNPTGGNPLNPAQQKAYDGFLAANPNATPEQLQSFAQQAGLGSVTNAKDIIAARQAGRGVAPASTAQPGYNDSVLSQGLSGVNEGVASTLGAPVDLVNSALGLGAQGINALANTHLAVSDNPFLGSQWWKDRLTDAGSIGPEAGHPFVRRVGQSVGAAAVPLPGVATTGREVAMALLSGLGGGVGAATAQQVAPGNKLAELGGELIGGGVSAAGSLANARRTAQRDIEAAIPTVPQLQDQAGALYRQAEANGVTASPQQTQDLADNMTSILQGEGTISPTGRVSEVHPKVREAYATVNDYAGQPMDPTQMQTVRGILGDGRMSAEPKEARISNLLLDNFDNWTAPLAPELSDARAVASRYLNAQTLEQARQLAEARAAQFSGSGLENAIRTEYRGLDRQAIKGQQPGLSDPVVDQIENVSRGTPLSNVARALGKFAPKGVVSAGLATGVPYAIGSSIGGPGTGAALSALTLGAGTAGRALATHLASRGADVAELLARNGGAIAQAPMIDPEIARILAASAAGQSTQYLDDPNAEQRY